jgi:hypothetical protein
MSAISRAGYAGLRRSAADRQPGWDVATGNEREHVPPPRRKTHPRHGRIVSRTRVGDIEIDGNNVRIGGAPTAAVPRSMVGEVGLRHRTVPPPSATQQFLHTFPISPGTLGVVGLSIAGLGASGLLLTMDALAPIAFLTHGIVLIPIGVGIAVLGALKWSAGRTPLSPSVEPADIATEDDVRTLTRLLATHDRTHTVEWIISRLGWHHDDVVRALAWLRDRDELAEELDPGSEQFYYVATRPQDLATHLRDLD